MSVDIPCLDPTQWNSVRRPRARIIVEIDSFVALCLREQREPIRLPSRSRCNCNLCFRVFFASLAQCWWVRLLRCDTVCHTQGKFPITCYVVVATKYVEHGVAKDTALQYVHDWKEGDWRGIFHLPPPTLEPTVRKKLSCMHVGKGAYLDRIQYSINRHLLMLTQIAPTNRSRRSKQLTGHE